eukprot:331413_1
MSSRYDSWPMDRAYFRRYGYSCMGEKFTWKDTFHSSDKVEFAKFPGTCDECSKSYCTGDLISIGFRQFNVDAPADLKGVDTVHYKCDWEDDVWRGRGSITDVDGYDKLSDKDKAKWLKWTTLLPKPPSECYCIQNFKKYVINFDWQQTKNDSSLTIKMFNNERGAYKKHYHLTYEVQKLGGKCEWTQQGCKKGKFSRWKKHIYSCDVTIYPQCRDKLLEKSESSYGIVGDFMTIAENALYFKLKSFGIPENVCSGWIYVKQYRCNNYHLIHNNDVSIFQTISVIAHKENLKHLDSKNLDADENHVYSDLEVVWGKLKGYVWWPAVIDSCFGGDEGPLNTFWLPVRFFGEDNHVYWLDRDLIMPFSLENEVDQCKVEEEDIAEYNESIKEAVKKQKQWIENRNKQLKQTQNATNQVIGKKRKLSGSDNENDYDRPPLKKGKTTSPFRNGLYY